MVARLFEHTDLSATILSHIFRTDVSVAAWPLRPGGASFVHLSQAMRDGGVRPRAAGVRRGAARRPLAGARCAPNNET